MPQASDADRDRYVKGFGFPDIGCEHAVAWLEGRGYTLTQDWNWIPPEETTDLAKAGFLIGFLQDEWDFGGLIGREPQQKEER